MPELHVETGPQKNQVFILRPPGPYRVGRDLDADVPLFDRRASRTHFRIDFRDAGCCLTDLASKSGTFVNDARVTSVHVLRHGDRIVAGKSLFSFAADGPDDPLVGRNFGGYKILERLGRGGMGTVYRAMQLSLDRVVALKVLSDELARDPDFSLLFVREARAAGELSHANIVRVYDVNSIDGILFYAMELTAHGSIEDLLRRSGRLSVEDALRVGLQAAAGLEYAEQEGVVHRDIKPANLMLHEDGTVKIGDLGIATRSVERGGGGGKPKGISGSPLYMSPEQALGRDVDVRADLYSLGATLHQLVSGSPPFRGQSLKEILFAHLREEPPDLRIVAGAPPQLAALVRSLLAKDPDKRPASASVVRQELESILRAESGKTKEVEVESKSGRRAIIGMGLGAALLWAVGFGLGTLWNHLGSVMSNRNARLARVRATIADGRAALSAGDVAGAVAKADELAKLQASPEEWQLLGREIEAFEKAVKAAAAKK